LSRICWKNRALALPLLAGALAGCGADTDYANDPRPPAPINVTAAIVDDRIIVSPDRFGAGPIVLIVSNQSSEAQQVTLETNEIDGEGPGTRHTSNPIGPSGTGRLKADVVQGSYELRARGRRVRPAALQVGGERQSAQNELLQP
jgi:hypothetical protein